MHISVEFMPDLDEGRLLLEGHCSLLDISRDALSQGCLHVHEFLQLLRLLVLPRLTEPGRLKIQFEQPRSHYETWKYCQSTSRVKA